MKRKALEVGVVLGRMGSSCRMVRVVLCDSSLSVCDGWSRWLSGSGLDVSVYSDSLATVLGRETGGAVAVVSPGNAFGFLGGGFDLALCRQFGGERFERWFRQRLGGGYYPVGSAKVVELDPEAFECGEVRYLVHVPTLVAPCRPVFDVGSVVASGYSPVFDAMWNALVHCPAEVATLVVPGLGTGYAGIPSEVACKSMVFALRVFALDVSRELKNTLIMYYLGVGYGAFVSQECLQECQRVGIDWHKLETFDVTSDDLDDILPSL